MADLAEDRRARALGFISQALVLVQHARDLLTEAGDQAEGGEMTAVLRILEDAQDMVEARNADALRSGGMGP